MFSTVIFLTGQYGTSHKMVANTLCKLATDRLASSPYQPTAKTYSIDSELWDQTGGPDAFFELANDMERDKYWLDAFSKIYEEIRCERPIYAIVSLHVVYFWKKRFFSCVNWDRLILLQPRVIITLIDDIYDIHARIINDQKQGSRIPSGKLSLSEILSWRIREIHTCNLLSKHLYIDPQWFPSVNNFLINSHINSKISREEIQSIFSQPCENYIISIKQDPEDFYRLLFDRKKLRVYLSFPISAPRKNGDIGFFNNLFSWRRRIHKECVAFDPLAIDELRFVTEGEGENKKIISPKLANRISYDIGTPIVPPPEKISDDWKISDLEFIRDSVVQQVGERDLKLTSQADLVAMWRPLYGGKTHDGVYAEGEFATAKGTPLHSYHPIQDVVRDKPFAAKTGVNHETEEELFDIIKKLQTQREEQQKEETYRQ